MKIVIKNSSMIFANVLDFDIFADNLPESSNPEFTCVFLDGSNHVLCGKKTNGEIYDAVTGTDNASLVVKIGENERTLGSLVSEFKRKFVE